jgi:hypothetical protein
LFIVLVRVEGLEPPCLAAPDPKSGMSTNFTTPAFKSLAVKGAAKLCFFSLFQIFYCKGKLRVPANCSIFNCIFESSIKLACK